MRLLERLAWLCLRVGRRNSTDVAKMAGPILASCPLPSRQNLFPFSGCNRWGRRTEFHGNRTSESCSALRAARPHKPELRIRSGIYTFEYRISAARALAGLVWRRQLSLERRYSLFQTIQKSYEPLHSDDHPGLGTRAFKDC